MYAESIGCTLNRTAAAMHHNAGAREFMPGSASSINTLTLRVSRMALTPAMNRPKLLMLPEATAAAALRPTASRQRLNSANAATLAGPFALHRAFHGVA